MNIFWVLNQGASRLHEPSMSAFLGYLLDTNHDHGLGDTFLRAFLQHIDPVAFGPILSMPLIDAVAELEQPYRMKGALRYIDVEISIFDRKKNRIFRILVENKVTAAAANPAQLAGYYAAMLEDEPRINNLYIVFLTPAIVSSALNTEFANLVVAQKKGHYKKQIFWDSPDGGVLPILRHIMSRELVGEINPINEQMRHTLKAFIKYVSSITQPLGSHRTRMMGDIGEVMDELEITLKDGTSYRVVLRDSSQVQVFDSVTGEKQEAKRVLVQYIDENALAIPHHQLNTRGIGRQFFTLLGGN